MAGTASLAGLGAFMTGMALSSPSDIGLVQAFGSPGGAAPVEAGSSSSSTEFPTAQASRGEHGKVPAASPHVAPGWGDDGVTVPIGELPAVPYGYQPFHYQPYDPSGLGTDSWTAPYGPLAPPLLTDDIDSAAVPPAAGQPGGSSDSVFAPSAAPSWLAEPTWVPETSSTPSTAPKPLAATPEATPPASSTLNHPHPTPPAPPTTPGQPVASGSSGTSLPFVPILDQARGGTELFQPASPSVSHRPAGPPSAPPAAAWPHD